MRPNTPACLIALVICAGCAVNPVTGERDFIIVSGQQELAMGEQNYAPMQQSQGGAYDVDPGLTAYVRTVGGKVAAASGVDLPYEFTVLNNSVPNAWALPGGKIAINRGLLTEMNSEAELAAVLGHEVVHAAARHSAQQQSRGMLAQIGVLVTGVAASDSDYGNLIVGSAQVGAQMLMMKYGRGAELESDKYGMRYMSKAGYDPQGAVELQETFVRLAEGRRQDWLSGLFSSHPPSPARVEANRKTAASLPPGGITGEDKYKSAMARTMELKPAYDKYDEGRKALAEKRNDEALSLANEALQMFPDEAHFHALRGDVRLSNKQFDMAVTNFSRAIARRDNFFYYHLQRGIARHELAQTDAAAADLENSLKLLPTAPAHYVLGEIEEGRGDVAAAINHYKVVAKSGGGEYGKMATDRLMRLELPSQPSSYIASACGDDGSGQVVIQVKNATSVPVTGLRVIFQYVDSNGAQRQQSRDLPGVLAGGQTATARTGLALLAGTRCQSKVTAATIAE
jgi:predicted Zn-dependent protease